MGDGLNAPGYVNGSPEQRQAQQDAINGKTGDQTTANQQQDAQAAANAQAQAQAAQAGWEKQQLDNHYNYGGYAGGAANAANYYQGAAAGAAGRGPVQINY